MAISSPETRPVTLTEIGKKLRLPLKIALPASEISAPIWTDMVAVTDSSGIEHGLVASTHKGKLYHGNVTKGFGERTNYDGPPGSKESPSWTPPLFPHGMIFPFKHWGAQRVLTIHTHPMPEEIAHVQTTHHSTSDMLAFWDSNSWASLMVDRGGAHLLTKWHDLSYPGGFSAREVIEKAYAANDTVLQVIRALAVGIERFGMQYYYTPDISYGAGDSVVFTDARALKELT